MRHARAPVEHWNNRRRPTAVCGDFVRFIPLLDGRSLMAVESLPGSANRLFPQSGRATRKAIGRRWSRPRQPSLEDGRASSQKTATNLRDLSDSGAHAGPFHLWRPRDASENLGAWSLECAVVRSRAPSNTELSGEGPRPFAWTSAVPILCYPALRGCWALSRAGLRRGLGTALITARKMSFTESAVGNEGATSGARRTATEWPFSRAA